MIPTHHHARHGLRLMVALWALLVVVEATRASDVPPLSEDVRRVMRDTTRVLTGVDGDKNVAHPTFRLDEPRDAQGGECWAPVIDDEDDIPERQLVERHLDQCSRAGKRADPWLVLRVVQLERELGVPEGLISAAVCWETGYTRRARGDVRDGHARAHGSLQLWPWWLRWGGLVEDARDDIDAAVRVYVARVYHYLDDGRCPGNWLRAEAMAANGPRYKRWGCHARSRHADEWARWR